LGQPYTPHPVRRELQDRLAEYFHEMQAVLALTLSKFAGPAEAGELQAVYRQQTELLEPKKQQALNMLERQAKVTDKFADLSERAESIAGQDQRDQALYSIVAASARENPKAELMTRLDQIVEKIQSPELHDKASAVITSLRIEQATQAGDLDRAYAMAARLQNLALRARTLRRLSLAVTRKGSQTLRSDDLLGQALEAAGKAEASIELTQLTFSITSDFVNLKDYDGAFKALETAAASLGTLKQADFEQTTREAVPNSLFRFDQTFGRVGAVDFDKAMFVAQTIKWREFRLAAEIATCRSALTDARTK